MDYAELCDGPTSVRLYAPHERYVGGFTHSIELTAGPFTGVLEAHAHTDPYPEVIEELQALYRLLRGEVRVGGYEDFDMRFKAETLGHIQVAVSAFPDPYRGVRLSFCIELDQTHLPPFISALKVLFGRASA